MKTISRRQFLYISALLSLSCPLSAVFASSEGNMLDENNLYPTTIAVLKSALRSEKLAFENYSGYSRKAIEEKYPNIAYLFTEFAVSEKRILRII